MWHTTGSSAQEGQYSALANGCHHWNLRSANQSWVWVGNALTFEISVLHGTNLMLFFEVIKLSLCTSAIYFTNSAVIIGSVACFDFRFTGIPFWDMSLCHWVISSRRCEGTSRLYPLGLELWYVKVVYSFWTFENQIPSDVAACSRRTECATTPLWQLVILFGITNQPQHWRIDMIWHGIFVNCNWIDTQWQQYSTHLHTNSTQNNTMKQNTQNRTYITVRIHKHNSNNT